MKKNSFLYTILIAILVIVAIYFISANVFNIKKMPTRYGGTTDIS